MVFEKNTPSSVGTNTYNVESLKTRITELENLVATLTVSERFVLGTYCMTKMQGNDEKSDEKIPNVNEEKELNGGNPNENITETMNRGTNN